MPRTQASSRLLRLVDSDSEDGLGRADVATISRQTRQFKQPQMPAAKNGRGRQAANKVTKPAQKSLASSTRRASGCIVAALEEAAEEGRTTLGEKSGNAQQQGKKGPTKGRRGAASRIQKTEDEDDIAMDDKPVLTNPPVSDAIATAAKPKAARGRPRKTAHEKVEVPDSIRRDPASVPRGKNGLEAPIQEGIEIAETQQPPPGLDLVTIGELEVEEEQLEDLPAPTIRGLFPSIHSTGQVAGSAVSRLTSADSFGGGDPALRRRLGEMAKKYESLELKYRDLRDIGIKEAERNFDRLKKQGEEKASAANSLIANLKAELAAQKELARDGQRLRRQLETTESRADDLQAHLTELTLTLSESRTEAKALAMKLAASRSAEAAATAAASINRVPGSALKGGSYATGNVRAVGGAAEAIQQASQVAQMKEDLYADLTGLIVRGVKRDGAEQVYDCLQTGRNGTLHFKLALSDSASSESYNETQFRYMPQLDPNRDRPLIETLPDFLVEDITFPRPHAAKFYARVMKSLTERAE